MSVVTELPSPARRDSGARAILGPAGNKVRVSEVAKRKKEAVKKPQKPNRLVSETPESVIRNNSSMDSNCSSDSSSCGSSVKMASAKRRMNSNVLKSVKVAPEGVEGVVVSGSAKRCDWITPNSDLLYTSFHDEEWGVPVHNDRKLFELLVLSQALAEFTWPVILSRRDMFRKLFNDFDPSSVANFTEKKLLALRSNGSILLSEPKLRAIVENAKLTLKIQQDFGSLSNFFWSLVNRKPIKNGFRYGRQVPTKTPKAEAISKDLMRRGFRWVGPSVIYSFMQVAGLTNDHLVTCFRYQECNNNVKQDLKPKDKNIEVPLINTVENACSHV
ncbi:DNA-3-methyladenine glycosylase I [Bertholletia excelsa]